MKYIPYLKIVIFHHINTIHSKKTQKNGTASVNGYQDNWSVSASSFLQNHLIVNNFITESPM